MFEKYTFYKLSRVSNNISKFKISNLVFFKYIIIPLVSKYYIDICTTLEVISKLIAYNLA